MIKHTCHAHKCEVIVKPEMLMCRKHWFMVPPDVRRTVLGAYRPGQCDDKKPSQEWLRAALRAIGEVGIREGAK